MHRERRAEIGSLRIVISDLELSLFELKDDRSDDHSAQESVGQEHDQNRERDLEGRHQDVEVLSLTNNFEDTTDAKDSQETNDGKGRWGSGCRIRKEGRGDGEVDEERKDGSKVNEVERLNHIEGKLRQQRVLRVWRIILWVKGIPFDGVEHTTQSVTLW
jgi:hypothetical protein